MPRKHFIAPFVFAILTLAMFGDLLVRNDRVVSFDSTDLSLQFLPWRDFGFSQMRAGHLPLWNPHIFGGTPYFAGFQAALLYPPNWLHLVLPTALAINWIVALHVFAAGYFTYLWCRGRSISRAGALLGGAMFMFSGPYFLHVYAGHLPHLAVMVWTPLMLLALDRLAAGGGWRWIALGIGATALHILAGHPQYVYYTGIALSIYVAAQLPAARKRFALASGFALIYIAAVLLTAIQLLPGIQAASEQVRSGGVPYDFASMFSLPIPNLITSLAPAFFGNVPLHHDGALAPGYWGAGYLWEMSLFVSVAGLILALFGATARKHWRDNLLLAGMVLLALLLALGRHTPLYYPLFKFLPGYGSFRGTVKFAYLSALFLAPLAGRGFDALRAGNRGPRALITIAASIGIALLLLGAAVRFGPGWAGFLAWMEKTSQDAHEWYSAPPITDADFLHTSAAQASAYCWVAGLTALLVAACAFASRAKPWLAYGPLAIALVELFVFARSTRATMDPAQAIALPPPWQQTLANLPADQRALIVPMEQANIGMSRGFDNLNGYDPGVQRRYAELIFASQHVDLARTTQYLPFHEPNEPVFRMLRCGAVCFDPSQLPLALQAPLPIGSLITDIALLESRDAVLDYVTRQRFDPAATIVLERAPDVTIARTDSPPGTVDVQRRGTDALEIRAALDRPAMLLITENFSAGWRIRRIEGLEQEYRIVPADWALIGVPLAAGNHHFMLEYAPLAFRVGRWVSGLSLLGALGAAFLFMRRANWFR